MKRIALTLLATCVVAPALADDLPGVSTPKQIVQPLPEPIDQQAATDKTAISVGDWDVNVSGSVTVDIGAGSARKPPR
jgi:hypothetical protein